MRGKILVLIGVTVGLAACGQGNEPMSALGNTSVIPVGTMDLPLASQLGGGGQILLSQPYSSSTPYFTLNGFTGLGLTVVPVRAPATGMVSNVVIGQSITILVTPRVSVQISNVNTSVEPGNYVTQDQQIGNAATLTGVMTFAVFVDGTAVCPLSFLSGAARSQLLSYYTSYSATNSPCQQ